MTVFKWLIIIGFMGIPFVGIAQKDRKFIREGNKQFKAEDFQESEVSFRKALELGKEKYTADFNIGDALFRQEKYEDAGNKFEKLSREELDKFTKANVYHNLGNSLLLNQKLEESIEAYKNALRNNPRDFDTKYNLAYAQNLLKQQQEQQEQNQDNKDNKDQKDKQDQQDKQDKKDQENKQQDQQQKEEQKQSQKISKEDANRLLEALANDEKKVQEKVKKAKAKQKKVRTLKEW